jgi:hypothetical protein
LYRSQEHLVQQVLQDREQLVLVEQLAPQAYRVQLVRQVRKVLLEFRALRVQLVQLVQHLVCLVLLDLSGQQAQLDWLAQPERLLPYKDQQAQREQQGQREQQDQLV